MYILSIYKGVRGVYNDVLMLFEGREKWPMQF